MNENKLIELMTAQNELLKKIDWKLWEIYGMMKKELEPPANESKKVK
jgi:hypothetical protein